MMMDIERLKELRAILERNSELEDEQIEILWELIDTAIARQLVKSEEVAEAIELLMELQHDNYVFQNYTEQDIKNYGLISIAITALQAYQPTTRKNRTVEPAAISKTETTSKSCWYCDGIQDHKVVFVKTVVDELGRELPAYDTPYNYCPNCGRKLREVT